MGKTLRSGYTTGACATAATKAALSALLNQKAIEDVTITLPQGELVTFVLKSCEFGADWGKASIIKDAGDDPDATHRAEIVSTVRLIPAEKTGDKIIFHAGAGVGTFTLPGLSYPPGEPAINPIPRAMLTQVCKEVAPGKGVDITLSLPDGEKIAKRTLNARLGIEGGISILGTTGIVRPYSNAAYIASITQGMDVAFANGQKQLVLSAGAKSEKIIQKHFDLPEIAFVQYGNFIGESLTYARGIALDKVSVCTMIGKLVKLAAGQMNLHSGESSFDAVFLQDVARAVEIPNEVSSAIARMRMARSLLEDLPHEKFHAFYDLLCEKAHRHGVKIIGEKIALEILLLNDFGIVIGRFPEKKV